MYLLIILFYNVFTGFPHLISTNKSGAKFTFIKGSAVNLIEISTIAHAMKSHFNKKTPKYKD